MAGAAGTGLAAATTAAAWHWLARRPLPKQTGTIELDGLEGRVRIRRDRWGVPHIEAGSLADLWFAQGFCHGQDRLWQMDFYRRVVSGRVSEIAGAEGLPVDRLMRTLGIRRTAEREAATLDPDLLAKLERFCEGVNAAVADAKALPFEMQLLRLGFEPWRPADILSLGKLLAFGLSTNWEKELLRADMVRALGPELTAKLDPGYPADNPVVDQSHWSGDGLAIAEQIDAVRRGDGAGDRGQRLQQLGRHRRAQRDRLAADRRRPPPAPEHAGHLVPGRPHPGRPLRPRRLAARHARRLHGPEQRRLLDLHQRAWPTSRISSSRESRATATCSRTSGARSRSCARRSRSRDATRPRSSTCGVTHHGPIVNEALGADEAEPLALSWLTLDEPTAFRGMFELHSTQLRPGAGRDARGAHLARLEPDLGRPPRLDRLQADRPPAAAQGRLPRPAEAGLDGGVRVGRDDPLRGAAGGRSTPKSGFLVTANNRIVGDEYPHHITSEWLDGFRARRIEEMLRASDEHDIEGFEAMQSDNLSIPGLEAARRLGRLAPSGQRERSAIERLRSWDGRLDPDSIAGTIYQAFLLRLAREVARAAIGDRDLAERWLDRADNGFTPHVTSPWRWHSHLMKLWEEGDEELIGRPWDELVLEIPERRARRPHRPLRPRPRGLALGPRPRDGVPASARRGQPAAAQAAQPQAVRRAARRRR